MYTANVPHWCRLMYFASPVSRSNLVNISTMTWQSSQNRPWGQSATRECLNEYLFSCRWSKWLFDGWEPVWFDLRVENNKTYLAHIVQMVISPDLEVAYRMLTCNGWCLHMTVVQSACCAVALRYGKHAKETIHYSKNRPILVSCVKRSSVGHIVQLQWLELVARRSTGFMPVWSWIQSHSQTRL